MKLCSNSVESSGSQGGAKLGAAKRPIRTTAEIGLPICLIVHPHFNNVYPTVIRTCPKTPAVAILSAINGILSRFWDDFKGKSVRHRFRVNREK